MQNQNPTRPEPAIFRLEAIPLKLIHFVKKMSPAPGRNTAKNGKFEFGLFILYLKPELEKGKANKNRLSLMTCGKDFQRTD